MVPDNDWYDESVDDDPESVEESIRVMPLYDEEGVEISDDELPWNNKTEDYSSDDGSEDWMLDDADEAENNHSFAEHRRRIAQSVREEALRRLELSARTISDFQALVGWYDREEQSRMRRERRYKSLRGDVPLEYDALSEDDILPMSMSQPTFRQICRGEFDDYLANCLFEMHDLTDRAHIRKIVKNLKLDYKEIVYFLGVRLYSTQKLADLRGQSERNIRKVRDTARRRIHRKLYEALMELAESGGELIHLEQDFMRTYTPTKRRISSDDNLFEHTSAHWAKYTDYQWRKAADGQSYLLPTDSAEAIVYNPIPLADQLVTDAVNIGLLIFHKQPDSEIQAAIRSFACAYGLLGLMTALPTTPRFVEYEKVYLLKNPFIRQESMDTLAYLKLFFPFRMSDFKKHGTESLWNVSGEDKMQAALAMTFRNEPRAKAMSFMRDYGERYDWLKEVFLDWAFTFVSAYMYYNDRDTLDQDTLALYRQGLACFEGNALSYHLELCDHTVMVWDFHSLMLAVKFLFSVRLTDPDNPMKLCAHCGKAFIAKRADSRFCSVECRSKGRKRE